MTQEYAVRRRRMVEKAVGYVVRGEQLLVFTHDDVPLHRAGVQVPAGSVEPGETPAAAVLREVQEETGLETRIVRALGEAVYDVAPARWEVHHRHFFLLAPLAPATPQRWTAGEATPSEGGAAQRWTCWWLPLGDGHVLSAGFGALLGEIFPPER